MSLQSIARAAFATIRTAYPETVVAVVSGSQTANGIRDSESSEATLSDRGETGPTTGIVRLDASEMNEPARGASVTVAGTAVWVTQVRFDPARALMAIHYSEQRPLTLDT